MTERPRFGEYATTEEQRRLAGLPPMDAVPEASSTVAAPVDATPARPAGRPWDRLVTVGLLAYGVINVFMTGIAYLDLPALMDQSMRMLGIEGSFTNFVQGRVWGTIAAIVLVVGWVATAWFSLRRLRTGKLTWWVPLVGAAATMIVATLCIMVPMMGDPAFIAYLDSARN